MIFSRVEIPPSIRQQTKLCAQKSACFSPKTEESSFEIKPLFFKNILNKTFFYSPKKWAQLFATKKARNMPNRSAHTKTCNSFKNMYLRWVLADLFDGKLELKGNNCTNTSKNCFSL
jgi:hypothetical protein